MNTKLSICTTVKNRSKVKFNNKTHLLFPQCIDSIVNSVYSANMCDLTEIIIADWSSTDWPIMEWIEDAVKDIETHVITIKGDGFSAGKGRNIAAEYARNNILFFVDADMIINEAVLKYGIESISKGQVYWPEVKYMKDDRGNTESLYGGAGNVFISKEHFYHAGKWPEYWEHSFEDIDMAKVIQSSSNAPTALQTNPPISIVHQYHPQDMEWKNKHAKATPEQKQEVDKRKDFYKAKQNDEIEELKKLVGGKINSINLSKRQSDSGLIGRDFPLIGDK